MVLLRTRLSIFIIAITFVILALHGIADGSLNDIPILEGKIVEYTAKSGEDLYPIAKKHNLAIEHVMFANGMKGIKTRPGQKLLIPLRRIPPPVSMYNGLVLNLPERGIYVYKNGKIKHFYPVAIGSTGKWMTPTGDFKITNKVKKPTWLPPEWAKEEKPVPAGPDNPLGDRWMGLNKPGYGIHATNRPVSIGLATSHGCIRMYPELAQELFEQVSVGTPVKIIYEPVKLGYDPKDHRIYMEVYPDVYSKTPGLLKYAKEKLAEHNLLGLINEKTMEKIVSQKRGIPEEILGSDITVKVDNRKQKLSFSPMIKDGKLWTTSEVLKPIGAVLVWNNKNKTVDIYNGRRKVSLKVASVGDKPAEANSNSELVSYLWEGRTIIPISYVLKQLGVNYQWVKSEQTLMVYSGKKKKKVKPKVKPTIKPTVKPTPKKVIKKKYFKKKTPTPSPKATTTPSPTPTLEGPPPSTVPDDIPPPEKTPKESHSPTPTPTRGNDK
ncbi:MAG: L,D-transpeptidase family protein [Candidatus Eremiobacteraeota bacterium]|nr:L,D-transpeptidase family protein [Candidatus Eremiobacteraeota bacterium]